MGPTVAIGEELGLVVNAKAAGKGKVSCVVVQPDGSEVEAEVLENEDGTFDIFYTAPAPGNYVIYVRFGGENIPRSPFKVMVRDVMQNCAHYTPKMGSRKLRWSSFAALNGRQMEMSLSSCGLEGIYLVVKGSCWSPSRQHHKKLISPLLSCVIYNCEHKLHYH